MCSQCSEGQHTSVLIYCQKLFQESYPLPPTGELSPYRRYKLCAFLLGWHMTFHTGVRCAQEMEHDQPACTLASMYLWGWLGIDIKGRKYRAHSQSYIAQLLNLQLRCYIPASFQIKGLPETKRNTVWVAPKRGERRKLCLFIIRC